MSEFEQYVNRWLELTRYTQAQLDQIHAAERTDPHGLNGVKPLALFRRFIRAGGPPWDPKKPEVERQAEWYRFRAHAGRLARRVLGVDYVDGLPELHRADRAIWADPYRPRRTPGPADSKVAQLYGKDAAADQGSER